ncbi:MAG: hypothetical protein QM731_27590 [Chitinophagaceae bacterium]
MKKISTLLGLAVACACVLFSCKKNDLPKRLCQIKTSDRYGPWYGGVFAYEYDGQRLLTDFSYGYPTNTHFYYIVYDSKKRPSVITPSDYSYKYKLYYEHDLVTRIDVVDGITVVQQAFLTYDHLGRLIEKRGLNAVYPVERWEYDGFSCNPKKRLFYRIVSAARSNAADKPFWTTSLLPEMLSQSPLSASIPMARVEDEQLDLEIYHEYRYDNKINPQSTLINFTLNPLFYGIDQGVGQFDPIPENNIISAKYFGKYEGGYFNYMEATITYQYDGLYPLREDWKRTYHFTSGGPDNVADYYTNYTYDCVNR